MQRIYTSVMATICLMAVGCTQSRGPASQATDILPPLVISGVPRVSADQRPISKIRSAYVRHNLPGLEPLPEQPPKYIIYTGPSN